MIKVFSIKIHIMVIQTSFLFSALKSETFFLKVLEFEVIELGHFGFDPGFEQL